MLRQMVVFIGIVLVTAAAAGACPDKAPFAAMSIDSSCSEERRACPTDFPIRFTASSFGYTMQPCDTAIWSFGDGTTASRYGGVAEVTHSYVQPGNYRVRLEIRNDLGRAEMHEHRVAISDFPPVISIPFELRVIPESNTTTDVVVERSGNTFEKVTVDYETYGVVTAETSGTLVFPPGVTSQKITVAILDDDLFGGDPWNWVDIRLLRPTGGTVLKTTHFGIGVTEDEPMAVISAPEQIIVSESEGVVRIPLRTSWPMAAELNFGYSVIEKSAKSAADFQLPLDPFNGFPTVFGRGSLARGQTTVYVEVPIVDDSVLETAETFEVVMYGDSFGIPAGPLRTVVIIHDDEAPRRRAVR